MYLYIADRKRSFCVVAVYTTHPLYIYMYIYGNWIYIFIQLPTRNTFADESPVPYRGSLLPDPRYDAVRCVAMAACDDSEEVPEGNYTARLLIFDPQGSGCSSANCMPDGLHSLQVMAPLLRKLIDVCCIGLENRL